MPQFHHWVFRRGTFVQAEFPSSYPDMSAFRPLRSTVITRFYATIGRSDSRPGPRPGLFIPPARGTALRPPRRVSQVPRLIFLRTPSPITPRGPAGAFTHCFPAGSRPLSDLEDRSPPLCANEAETGSLALWLTDSPLEASPVELLPLALDWLPVERAITGQAPFILQDQARLVLAHQVGATPALRHEVRS